MAFMYFKSRQPDSKFLEARISELITHLTSIETEKQKIYRYLIYSVSNEKSEEYIGMEANITIIYKKCTKFINKYRIISNQSSLTAEQNPSNVHSAIQELNNLKSNVSKFSFFQLAMLSRDIGKLSAHASEVLYGLKQQYMTTMKSELNQDKLNDSNCLPVFNAYVDEVLEYLSEKGNTIGIFGPIGVGKTTVLRNLHNRLIENKTLSGGDNGSHQSLEHIVWTVFPRELETQEKIVEKLQNEIMRQLEIDHDGTESMHSIANTISTFLCHKKYILLMDQVSDYIDLCELGFREHHEYKKIVIASSEKKVIWLMTEHAVEILRLEKDEAWRLFENTCGKIYDSRKRFIADGIIECCAGIPSAINNVAKYLRGMEDEDIWNGTKRILQSGDNKSLELIGLGGMDKVYEIIYEELKTEKEVEIQKLEEEYAGSLSEQTFNLLRGHGVQQYQDAGTSASTNLPAIEPVPTSESMPRTEFLMEGSSDMLVHSMISSSESDSSFISGYESKQQLADEIAEEGITLEDNSSSTSECESEQQFAEDIKTEMFRDMSISVSGFDSQQRIESECHDEIQVVDEMTTQTGAEIFSVEQRETEPISLNAERSKYHEGNILWKEDYLVVVEDNLLWLKLDNQNIFIGDYPSRVPRDSSPVSAVLNLAEQDLRELPEKPDYTNSLLLFLQRNKRLTLIRPSFLVSMPDLRFLDISDTKIRILPRSLFRLWKLKVLMLRNCVCLENLPPDIGQLYHMEALDLSGTELYDLPNEIGLLTLLRSLQLSFYGPDDESEYEHLPSQIVFPSFLSQLKEIRALSISVHPEDHRWTDIAACIIKDISKLEMLNYLQFYFPEVEMFENFIQMSRSWEKQKVSKFDFIVGQNVKRIVSRVPDEVETLFNQQERCLRYVNGDKASPSIKTMLIRVTAFYLDHHTEVRSLSEFGITNFQALKFCVVRECPNIQAILDEKNAGSAFPCLEHLGIYFLWELKHIWKLPSPAGRLKRILKTPKPSENFKALRYLIINTCPKLQFILWESMLHCLTSLEELVVEDCERVEKIIKEESKKVKYEDNVLPGLRKLVLHCLPELVSLGNGVRLSKEKVSFNGCPKLILNSGPLR